MNYFRLFGALLILLCCTLSGFYFSYRLKQKLGFFSDLVEFTSRLETDIRYFGGDIYKLLRLSAPVSLSAFLNNDIKPFSLYWQTFTDDIAEVYRLSSDERSRLIEFGRLLGTTDTEGQISHIHIYKGVFTTERNDFQKEFKTKSRLYKTLGFFAGASLALLLL